MSKTAANNNLTDAMRMRDIAINALEDAKGEDIRILDVRNLTDVTDYMIVVSGNSNRHNKSLANSVLEQMHEAGWQHMGVEGEDIREWILVDFVDIVVHVMRATTREQYDLESLWDETLSQVLHKQDLSADEAAEMLQAGKNHQ